MKRAKFILIILTICIALTSCSFVKNDYVFNEIYQWELKNASNVIVENGHILSFRDGIFRITALEDINDIKRFRINIENSILRTYGDKIYIANANTGTIYELDYNAEVTNKIELNENIFNFKIIDGYIVYHLKTDLESVGVIGPNGSRLMKLDFAEKILDFDYNPKTEQMAVVVFDNNNIGSKALLYEDIDHPEHIDLESEIIVAIDVTDLGNYIILTDTRLYYFSGTELVWQKDINLLKDYLIEDKNIYLLDRNSLRKINLKGDTKREYDYIGSNNRLLHIKGGFLKDEFFIYGENSITGFFNGKRELNYETDLTNFYVDDGRYFILKDEILKEYEIIDKAEIKNVEDKEEEID